METDDSNRDFQIRPPRGRQRPSDETWAWNGTLKRIMHYARITSAGPRSSGARDRRRPGQHEFKQRCAVRVTYASNRTPGQWKAHGVYLSRETAIPEESKKGFGFDSSTQPVAIASTLDQWQAAGDRRLFKIILSPEFGDRLDLEQLTRELMSRMEADLGTRLQWVAATHDNTQYPHVHIALRGVRDDGRSLRIDRDYIKYGIRANAQDAATAQIGYRTQADAEEAQRREINQTRFTSLDRILERGNRTRPVRSSEQTGHFVVDITQDKNKVRRTALQARLLCLSTMGLAEKAGYKSWHVRSDFQLVLRAMQRTSDRQRALADRSALLSDNRLQTRLTDVREMDQLEGRILGHGEEEQSGRSYMFVEGTDRTVHFIYHNSEIERARQRGLLKPDSFLRLRTLDGNRVSVEDLGGSKLLLANKDYFRRKAKNLVSRGIIPTESGLGGWLGKYEAALSAAAREFEGELPEPLKKKPLQR